MLSTFVTLNKRIFSVNLVLFVLLSLGCSSPAQGETKRSSPQKIHLETYPTSKTYQEKSHNKKLSKLKNTFQQMGKASWYGEKFHGRKTANGESFNMNAMTAAHRTLPFGTKVEVTDLDSGKKVIVRINDRGPYSGGRIIDLSKKAASKLGIIKKGVARVHIKKSN